MRRVFCRVDGFLIAPWLLGWVVEMVWVVSANLSDRWWLSVYGY